LDYHYAGKDNRDSLSLERRCITITEQQPEFVSNKTVGHDLEI